MTCAQAEEYLLESLDAPLPVEVRRAVDLHVSSCAGCGALATGLRAVELELVAALPPTVIGTAVWACVGQSRIPAVIGCRYVEREKMAGDRPIAVVERDPSCLRIEVCC